MKKTVAIVAGAVLVISAAILVRRFEAQRAHRRLAQQANAVRWNEFVKQFREDIPLGTPRSELKRRLDSQKLVYSEGRDIMVKLGEEPGNGFVCDRWMVYADFEFMSPSGADPSPGDVLNSISWKRIGHCL